MHGQCASSRPEREGYVKQDRGLMEVVKDWKEKAVVQVGNFIARWPSPRRGVKKIDFEKLLLRIKMADLLRSISIAS